MPEHRKTLSEEARENGVGTETLRGWVKKYREAHPQEDAPLSISERARLAELERENRELKLEREFLGSDRPRSSPADSPVSADFHAVGSGQGVS